MPNSLSGKVALVTGAGRGIGAAIAVKFAEEGADLVLAARTRAQIDETKSKIEALGRHALAVETDISDREQAVSLARSALDRFGTIDIIVSNAARSGVQPMESMPAEYWREVQATNLEGPLAMIQALAPSMFARKSGSIIFVSSIRGLGGVPYGGAYAASKAAINSVTKTLAVEWGPKGVRVNAILPGPVYTDAVKTYFKGSKKLYDYYGALAPLKRWTQPEDCAGPAVFLASDAACAVTGLLLVVDGGLSAQLQDSFAPPPGVMEDNPAS